MKMLRPMSSVPTCATSLEEVATLVDSIRFKVETEGLNPAGTAIIFTKPLVPYPSRFSANADGRTGLVGALFP